MGVPAKGEANRNHYTTARRVFGHLAPEAGREEGAGSMA
jgi:hypothetical protein